MPGSTRGGQVKLIRKGDSGTKAYRLHLDADLKAHNRGLYVA